MGSVVKAITGEGGASTGGAGGIDDIKNGMIDQSNEIWSGMGADANARRTMNQQFTQQLASQAMGTAPSIANAQLQMAMDKNLAQQVAAAKANRAVNPALAARLNVQQGNQMAQQTAQQGAVNRLAEQQANQAQFAGYTGQQYQLAAQARAAAMGGAQAAANINAANQQRDINMITGLAQAGASGATMGAGKPPEGMSDQNLKTLVKKYNKGGMVKKFAKGGVVDPRLAGIMGGLQTMQGPAGIPDIAGGQYKAPDAMSNGQNMQQMGSNFGQMLARLGKTSPASVAGGPMDNMGGMQAPDVMTASKGAVVPGQAQVNGDSEKNDTVPALLSPGEIVVPRTVVAKGSKAAAKFVANAIKEKSGSSDKVQKKADGGKVDQFDPQNFLDALKPVSYNYKKDAKGPGVDDKRHLGVMAQDLEKAGPVGRSMVEDTPNGKQVNYGAGFGSILAAQSHLNERLKLLEKRYGKGK